MAIPTRQLGSDGPEVGAVGLGCMGLSWAYGDGVGQQQATAVIHRALELGCTFLDTADMYGPHTNEQLVGEALRDRRDDVVLATKCGITVDSDNPAKVKLGRDGSPAHVREACDASLQRLQTDRIDLYYLHRVDPEVPIEDSVGAMAALVEAGKVLRIGLSEVTVEELDRAQAVHPIAAVQSELSLWTRDPLENGVLEWCRAHGAAFVPFSPLGRGFLTGRYREASFGDRDFRRQLPRFEAEALEANLALADRVAEIAAAQGVAAGQVAIAWTLAQGEHVVPIPGTKRLEYLEENVGAAGLLLDAATLASLDSLPPAVGGRY